MEAIKELLYSIGEIFARMMKGAMSWFMGLDLINQGIILNTITAFFAIILPVGKYYIFETWFEINNPQAVYLIGIVFIMIGTIYAGIKWGFIIRLVVNGWYLLWLFIVSVTKGISHAPYELSMGYFFNIAAPLIYIILSLLYYLPRRD